MAVSLEVGVQELSVGIAAKINELTAKIGDVTSLNTTAKGSLVLALNEIKNLVSNITTGPVINDSATGSSTTWSSNQVQARIDAAIAALVNGAPGALNQINELASALGNDANFATTVANALSLRLRFDADQTLTAAQKLQAGKNLGIGDVTHDFVADFNAALN